MKKKTTDAINIKDQIQNTGIQIIYMGIQTINIGMQMPNIEMDNFNLKKEIQNLENQLKNIKMQINNKNQMNNNIIMKINNDNNKYINVIFKNTIGVVVPMALDSEITVSEMLKKYLKKINRAKLINSKNKSKDIKFLFNASILSFDDEKKIGQIFEYNTNPSVIVHESKIMV